MDADLVILSIIIDVLENRAVSMYDVKGTYLNTLLNEFLYIKFEGEQVKIICEINPDYEKYIRKERGRNVLYIALNKALHGCV